MNVNRKNHLRMKVMIRFGFREYLGFFLHPRVPVVRLPSAERQSIPVIPSLYRGVLRFRTRLVAFLSSGEENRLTAGDCVACV